MLMINRLIFYIFIFLAPQALAADKTAPLEGRPVMQQSDQSQPLEKEFSKANHLLDQGKLEEATEQYDRILSLWPDNVQAKVGKGNIAITQGDYDGAFMIFSDAAHTSKDSHQDIDIEIGLILSLVLAEKSETPERDLRIALSMNPLDTRVLNALGRMADNEKNWITALEYYTQALQTGDATARVLNNLGVSLMMQERFPEAIEKFKQAQGFENVPESVAHNLSRAYILSGDYRRALSLSGAKNMVALYNDAGVFAMEQEKFALSKCLIETAIDISATHNPEAFDNLKTLEGITSAPNNCESLGN